MTKKQRLIGALGLLLVVLVGSYAYLEWQAAAPYDLPAGSATTTPGTTATTTEEVEEEEPQPPPRTSSSHSYGTATIRMNEVASFPDGLAIRVASVLEDSRCPSDVNCIQAGTVRVSLRTTSASGASANELGLGSSVTTESQKITFLRVTPENRSTQRITDADYRFTFEVSKRNDVTPPPTQGACFVGGCSAQLCTDEPNMASTCEFRAEYACYRTAKCERQPTGQCGWTPSSELTSCLANPPDID